MSNSNQFMLLVVIALAIITSTTSMAHADEGFNINSNKKCIMCHKKTGKMFGTHAQNSLEISCQDCHGKKEGHPRKESNLIGFGTNSTASKQTAACLQCHQHDSLTEADWTHAVHSDKVNCANCHQLHTDTDPMIGVGSKERSNLCVECHTSEQEGVSSGK